jgi:hypothetical protein
MPGTPPLAPPAAEASLGLKLGRTAAALSVLLLGTALVLAPSAVLGNLLSTTAESVTGVAGGGGGGGQQCKSDTHVGGVACRRYVAGACAALCASCVSCHSQTGRVMAGLAVAHTLLLSAVAASAWL